MTIGIPTMFHEVYNIVHTFHVETKKSQKKLVKLTREEYTYFQTEYILIYL